MKISIIKKNVNYKRNHDIILYDGILIHERVWVEVFFARGGGGWKRHISGHMLYFLNCIHTDLKM